MTILEKYLILYDCLGPDINNEEGEDELSGVLALLRKYLNYLCNHVLDLLHVALQTCSQR